MKFVSKSELALMTDDQKLDTFRAMAKEYMAEKKCRWSEACLELKRRYPEARVAFGAPERIES